MPSIQLNLSEDADKKVRIFMAMRKLGNKQIAVNQILEEVEYPDLNNEIL